MSERDLQLYIADIKQAIDKIEHYTETLSLEKFRNDDLVYDAVIRNFEVIGEAATNIPVEIQKKNADIPWAEIVAMRNKVIHEYFGIDADIVWETVKQDLPKLKEGIKKLEESV